MTCTFATCLRRLSPALFLLLVSAPAHAASFDGPWTVTIVTQSGRCDTAYSFPLNVYRGRVTSPSGVSINGRVGGGGGVSVSIASGGSHGSASGRLYASSGAGRWSGVLGGERCSGRWEAYRG